MRMKIGVLSDTHLHGVPGDFEDIYKQYLSDADLILHAGDFVSSAIINFLSIKDFQGVHGNMDPLDVRETLPRKKIINLGPRRLGLIHGWGSSEGLEDRIISEFQGVDIIVYGHSHKPANHMKEGIFFFNPGTASGYTRSGIHSIGILHLDDAVHGEIVHI